MTTMTKSGPWPTVILVVVSIAATVLVMTQLRSCGMARPTGQMPDSVMYWRNQANKEVASLRGAVEDFGVQSKKLTDSIARVYGAKFNQLKEYLVANTRTQADIPLKGNQSIEYRQPIVYNNSDTCPPQIKNIAGTFESPYYVANVQLGEDPRLKLVGFDTLTVVWKDTTIGRWFKKRQYLQLDVSLANPDTRITGLTSYRVPPPKPKKWAIGFQAGYGIYFDIKRQRTGFAPYFGIGATKTLLRF